MVVVSLPAMQCYRNFLVAWYSQCVLSSTTLYLMILFFRLPCKLVTAFSKSAHVMLPGHWYHDLRDARGHGLWVSVKVDGVQRSHCKTITTNGTGSKQGRDMRQERSAYNATHAYLGVFPGRAAAGACRGLYSSLYGCCTCNAFGGYLLVGQLHSSK